MARPVYVSDEMPGIRRHRRGRGFQYVADSGRVTRTDRERIAALAIPPAWSDVWICADPGGHIQATGRDGKGRKQYRYSNEWRRLRDGDKFERIEEFGAALPDLRADLDKIFEDSRSLDRDVVMALVIALLDETLIRIGNPEYASNGSFGLTTFRNRHLDTSGGLSFVFVGKGGIKHEVELDDPRLARLVRRCHRLGGQRLFTYRDADSQIAPITSSDVNEALGDLTGLEITAKDFRTWGGTVTVTESLARSDIEDPDEALLAAIDDAADRLGNSRSVCRSSYVHPAVIEAAAGDRLEALWARSRDRKHLRRGEVVLLDLLGSTG